MKILVTGGAGFIGSHVVDQLIDDGYEVIVVDNLSTGRKENINPKAKFYGMDINSENLEELFKEINLNVIIHLAAQVSVVKSMEDSFHDAQTNIMGSLKLIDLAKKQGVDKFIYINSAAIYGPAQELPITENHPKNPSANYGISKNCVEDYLRVSGLNVVSLRLANVYGPRQIADAEGGVVAIFTKSFVHRQPISIHGDGEQSRDFVYVKDVAKAVVSAISAGSGCFNIGTGKSTTVNQLIAAIQSVCGYSIPEHDAPPRGGDIRESVLEVSRAKEFLKWQARTSLEKGVKETVEYEINERNKNTRSW